MPVQLRTAGEEALRRGLARGFWLRGEWGVAVLGSESVGGTCHRTGQGGPAKTSRTEWSMRRIQ